MLQEFELIQFLSQHNSVNSPYIKLGIGDDAALTEIPFGFQWVSSVDTSIGGIHFPAETSPQDIGFKSLAVSLSDMAAMGAEPIGVLLALTLPDIQEAWLKDFATGFFELVNQFQVPLIGGDTTQGALSISTLVQGMVPCGQAILRSGAKPGDLIYVSGYLGDAGLALQDWRMHRLKDFLLQTALNRPQPRVALGLALRTLASSAIDISDGLAQDLKHILVASQVGARLQLEQLPLSELMRARLSKNEAQHLALNAGDDYELCFTINPCHQPELQKIVQQLNLPLTKIGEITTTPGIQFYKHDQRVDMQLQGYQHFKAKNGSRAW